MKRYITLITILSIISVSLTIFFVKNISATEEKKQQTTTEHSNTDTNLNVAKEVIQQEEPSIFPYSFTDDIGNTVIIERMPENVAVLYSSYADIWKLAGGNVAITVEETVTRQLVDASNVTIVGPSNGKEIDKESLIAAKPDFVIMTTDYSAQIELADYLKTRNIPTALFRVDDVYDYAHMLEICTNILDTRDRYERYGASVLRETQAIIRKAKQQNACPTVLLIHAFSSGAQAKTTDHFVGKMLRDLSTDNIATHANTILEDLSVKSILNENPDHIFVTTLGEDSDSSIDYMNDQYVATSAFQSLTAIHENHYYILPKDLFMYKPNAKWADAYRYLAKLLYPEAF